MVLLHGGGTSYLGVLPTAEKIAEKYHVVLLAYDGFNPSEPETEFQSLAYEAGCLEDYIIENYGGKVDILYGLSYGCRTLMQVLEDNLEELKAKGYPFTCKIFEDMGHGGLIGENTERFIEEVEAVHRHSMKE